MTRSREIASLGAYMTSVVITGVASRVVIRLVGLQRITHIALHIAFYWIRYVRHREFVELIGSSRKYVGNRVFPKQTYAQSSESKNRYLHREVILRSLERKVSRQVASFTYDQIISKFTFLP